MRVAERDVRIDEAALRDAVDVPAGTVELRSNGGSTDTIAHPPAVSLPRVLELAGVAPAAISFAAIARPNGSLLVLRPAQLTPPPLVWLDADSVRFVRPIRDPADVNAADNIATAGDDLVVEVRQGPLLEVAVRVAPERPRAGERVRLEARVRGASRGAALDVRWRFGDGATATGAAVRHRWRHPGVFAVVASAAGEDDSAGASEPVVVRVGEARERPGRRGGGDGDEDRAPAFGPSEPPGLDEAGGDDADGAASDAPAADAGADPGEPAGPDESRSPAPDGAAHPDAARGRARAGCRAASRCDDAASRRDRTVGVPVRGVLVTAAVPAPLPAGASPPASAARPGAAPPARDATLAAGTAIAAGLLALGAWRERRRRP